MSDTLRFPGTVTSEKHVHASLSQIPCHHLWRRVATGETQDPELCRKAPRVKIDRLAECFINRCHAIRCSCTLSAGESQSAASKREANDSTGSGPYRHSERKQISTRFRAGQPEARDCSTRVTRAAENSRNLVSIDLFTADSLSVIGMCKPRNRQEEQPLFLYINLLFFIQHFL